MQTNERVGYVNISSDTITQVLDASAIYVKVPSELVDAIKQETQNVHLNDASLSTECSPEERYSYYYCRLRAILQVLLFGKLPNASRASSGLVLAVRRELVRVDREYHRVYKDRPRWEYWWLLADGLLAIIEGLESGYFPKAPDEQVTNPN